MNLLELPMNESKPKENNVQINIPNNWKPIRGRTYPIKEELKELGAKWDRDTGLWWIDPSKLHEAEELVENKY